MSYKKDIQRCQELIQKNEFQKALTLSEEIITSIKSSDDDKDKPILYLAQCIKGLVHFNLGKDLDSILLSENEHLRESENTFNQANEIEKTKFQSYKGLIDLYIYIHQKINVNYKYILGLYDKDEVNIKEYHDYYKDIMEKMSNSIDGFINSRGGKESAFPQLRLKKLEYFISSGNFSKASKYVNAIREEMDDEALSKDSSKFSKDTYLTKLYYFEMLSLFGTLSKDLSNLPLLKSVLSYFKSVKLSTFEDYDRFSLFNIYFTVLIFIINNKDEKTHEIAIKTLENELEEIISQNSMLFNDILQDSHTCEHLILALLRLGNIKNFNLSIAFEIYETQINQNLLKLILSYIHLYPHETLSKILYFFLNKHKWVKKEEERDPIILFIRKTMTNIESTPSLRYLSLRIIGLSVLSLASRSMNNYKSTIDYCKEGLELIKKSNFSHPYFYVIFHLVLGLTLRSNKEKILTYENILQFDSKNAHAIVSLAEIHYHQKEYEKCKEYYSRILDDQIFGDLAKARVLWIDAIPFILLSDKNTIIHNLKPLYKSYTIEVSRKDYILVASKAIEGMNKILEDNENMNARIKSWILFWLGRLEWALNHYEKAKDHWTLSSNLGLPIALAFVGHYYENSYNNHKYLPDLEKAKDCYRVSLKRYELFRQSNDMIREGVGDGKILQEAAIPLLEILTTQSLDKDIDEKERGKYNNQILQLLTSLSDSGVHWALFKIALCRMREKQYHLSIPPLQDYIRRNPKDIDAWICLSDVYTRVGKYTAALKISERVYDMKDVDSKNKLISLYQCGIIKMKLGSTKQAKKYFKHIIKQLSLHKDEFANDAKMNTIDVLSKYYLGVTLYEEQKLHLQEGRIIDLYKSFRRCMKFVKEIEKEVEKIEKQTKLDEDKLNLSIISLLKLIGDIYTFSYHLRSYINNNENDVIDNSNEFIENLKNIYNVVKRGSRFYFSAIQHDKERHNIHYDLSINYLYQALILSEIPENGENNQHEILLLYDQSIKSLRDALSFDINNSFYWTTLGNICSLYLNKIENYLSKDLPLSSKLVHIPLHNITQKYFLQAIKISSKNREQSVFTGYAWSSMLLFWMMNLVDDKYIKRALDFILNIDPLNPLLRGIESIISFKYKIERKELDGDLRGHIENYLNHLEHTISISNESYHSIHYAFVKEYGRIFCRFKGLHKHNYGFILNHLLRYTYINPRDIEACNLIGNIASIAGLDRLAEKYFERASVLSSKANTKYELNLALSLEKNGKFEEANKIYNNIDHIFAKVGELRILFEVEKDKEKLIGHTQEFLKSNLKSDDEFYNFILLFFTKTLLYNYYGEIDIDKAYIDSYISFSNKSVEENNSFETSYQLLSKRNWFYKLSTMIILNNYDSKNYIPCDSEEALFEYLNKNFEIENNKLEFDNTNLTMIMFYYYIFIKNDLEKVKDLFLLCEPNEESFNLCISYLLSFYDILHDKVKSPQIKLPFNAYFKHLYTNNLAKYTLISNRNLDNTETNETKNEETEEDKKEEDKEEDVLKDETIVPNNFIEESLKLSLESVMQSPWDIHSWASLGYSYLASNNNKPLLAISKSIEKQRTIQFTDIGLRMNVEPKLMNEIIYQIDILTTELIMRYYIECDSKKEFLVHTESILKGLEDKVEIKNNIYLSVLLNRQKQRLESIKNGNDKNQMKQNALESYKLIQTLLNNEVPKLYETPKMILALRMLMEVSGNMNKKMKEKLIYLANKWFSSLKVNE